MKRGRPTQHHSGPDPLRPVHCRKFAQFSIEWYLACEEAFRTAMQDERRRQLKEMKEAS